MTTAEPSDVVDDIVTRTGEYFERVETATRVLLDLIESYGRDEAAFRGALERLGEIESECDAILADLRSLVGNVMDPNFSELYLMSGEVIEFYETADAVVNHAETVGNELAAMSPTLSSELRADVVEMAELVRDAAVHLSRAATIEIRNVSSVEGAIDVSREAEQIRMLESQCDDRKHEALRKAFAAHDSVDALLVRELLHELDDVANAIEDATDRLVYVRTRND